MSLPVDFSPVLFRTGYSLDAKPEIAIPDPYGVVEIRVKEVERIEVYLGGEEGYREIQVGREREENKGRDISSSSSILQDTSGNFRHLSTGNSSQARELLIERKGPIYCGYLVVGNELKPLPIGSTLDSERGIFYWQSGPGFLGTYDFVFIKEDVSGFSTRRWLRVIIWSKY
jgi:hypothetical protein